LAHLANPETGNILVLGEPVVMGASVYVETRTGTSARLQPVAGSASIGRPQILRETESLLSHHP
jgi:hypothetical protein